MLSGVDEGEGEDEDEDGGEDAMEDADGAKNQILLSFLFAFVCEVGGRRVCAEGRRKRVVIGDRTCERRGCTCV